MLLVRGAPARAAPLALGVMLAAGLMALPVIWFAKATQPMPAVAPDGARVAGLDVAGRAAV